MSLRIFFLSWMAFWLIGCGARFETLSLDLPLDGNTGQGSQSPPPPPSQEPPPSQPGSPDDSLGGICSKLDFSGIEWSPDLEPVDRKSFALALNITSSFEGRAGWTNLTNNFDRQGMSLGLLQQNLGQGSLQPLLLQMAKAHPTAMQSHFSLADFLSLQAMLQEWEGEKSQQMNVMSDDELFPEREILSPLDKASLEDSFQAFLTSDNAKSVAWAVTNLYLSDQKTFITRWKNSWTSMANSAPYRSLQIRAAEKIYKKAVGYFESFGFRELRMLLMTFDYVTQNGGFNSIHRAEFQKYLDANPGASEKDRAVRLLEIRLKDVIPEYVEDVRSRKMTLINGSGKVHGSQRNLPTEYCFSPTEKMN